MTKRQVFLIDNAASPWISFLQDFFEVTSTKPAIFSESIEAGKWLAHALPDLGFINPELLTPVLIQKLKVWKQSRPELRLICISGDPKKAADLVFDETFIGFPEMREFELRIADRLPLPENLRMLVIDDEEEIGEMMKNFFGSLKSPSFSVDYRNNGKKGLETLLSQSYDIVILDIKMPVMDGREVYREIRARGIAVPVIVFFDAISGDEVEAIHQFGRPAILDKGSRESELPHMLPLVKKLIYFA